MPDWSASMQQTFEYYTVDPDTWEDRDRITTVISSSISRESSSETLGHAELDVSEAIPECYIRIYLKTIQNGVTERHPLGTFLAQTPSESFNGKRADMTLDAYTPLLELKENPPPLGYYVPKNTNTLDMAYSLAKEHMRAPVVKPTGSHLVYSHFVANTDDTWLSYLISLVGQAEYHLGLDEMGRLIFLPNQDTDGMQPVWEFNDGNSSILYPDMSIDHDFYGIPNVVEVIYSVGSHTYHTTVKNENPESPVSVQNRGREILYRITDPGFIGAGEDTETLVEEYAKRILKEKSTVSYQATFKHGYCPVRLGDCVRIDYRRADLRNIHAKVISQSIDCKPGCAIETVCEFKTNLWG